MEAQALLEGISRNVPRARQAQERRQPDTCLLHAHMAAEYACKLLHLRQGGKVGYATFKGVIDALREKQTVSGELHAELDWLRRLRNRVYHEAYLPILDESARALRTAEAVARLVDLP